MLLLSVIQIFCDHQNAATKMSKKGKKKTKTTSISCTRLDHSSLASGHHNAFVASLVFLSDMFVKGLPLAHADILLVGLGGGALPQFMNKYLCNVMCGSHR